MSVSSFPPEPAANDNGGLNVSNSDDAVPLTVSLGEHLDRETGASLESITRPRSPTVDIVRRNPKSVALAVGGVAALVGASLWILRSLGRGRD